MKNFLVNPSTGDIVLDPQRKITMVYNDDAIIQKMERTITTNLGEWFLNPLFGFPRFEVLGEKYNQPHTTQLLHDAILQVEEIERVEKLTYELDRSTRSLVADIVVIKTNGELLEVGEVAYRIGV